ncbi:hypothetical protein [Streptomyces sp. NPDC050988]|uniref:hypothetical protein n=1 Tax=Streptomyces sp. NPDC050988 TaxID=3365637 RepID=UPI0037A8B94E
MIEHDHGSGPPPDPLEQRLGDALRARADSVGLSDLRPAAPPSGSARFRPLVSVPVRRAVLLLVLAAVVVGVLFASAHWERPEQAPPANAPTARPTTPGVVTASPGFRP